MPDTDHLTALIGTHHDRAHAHSLHINHLRETQASHRRSIADLSRRIDAIPVLEIQARNDAALERSNFLGLADTPSTFNSANNILRINDTNSGVEFVDLNTIIPAPSNENYIVKEYSVTTSPTPADSPVVLATSGGGDVKINARLNITCYEIAGVSSNTQQLTVDVSAQSLSNSQIVIISNSHSNAVQFMSKLFFQQNGSVLELCFLQSASPPANVVVRLSNNADNDSGKLNVAGTNSLTLPSSLVASKASNPTQGDICEVKQATLNTSNDLGAKSIETMNSVYAGQALSSPLQGFCQMMLPAQGQGFTGVMPTWTNGYLAPQKMSSTCSVGKLVSDERVEKLDALTTVVSTDGAYNLLSEAPKNQNIILSIPTQLNNHTFSVQIDGTWTGNTMGDLGNSYIFIQLGNDPTGIIYGMNTGQAVSTKPVSYPCCLNFVGSLPTGDYSILVGHHSTKTSTYEGTIRVAYLGHFSE